ncbi:RluA family pseudouridine synthase [Acidocella sp.]|uniref:RluA family pseudouridine synthase n=1 Tax=Acidocella sp. TaxID=50710 RepID=UPI00261C591F|nr:RluA family pseudouridine synthase [Acidocella sp.]
MADPSWLPVLSCTATPEEAGARLDSYLAARLGAISRSRIKALILEGRVTRDGATTRDASESVQAGATYRLSAPAPEPATPRGQNIAFPILYEDSFLLVLDKPAGLVVHPAPGNPDGTLVNALIAHCGESLTGIGGEKRPGIVHRLDKDTSGVMVVAKTELAHTRLSAAFAARDIERAYKAICWGVPNPGAGQVEGDIGRDPRERKRMAVVTRNGKYALTSYRIVNNFGLAAALITCHLATGRTHQIRVHMAHIGHPLVGDPVYLKRRPAAAKHLAEPARSLALDFPRQALHAESLGFSHPITGQPLSFATPPPEDFRALERALLACT